MLSYTWSHRGADISWYVCTQIHATLSLMRTVTLEYGEPPRAALAVLDSYLWVGVARQGAPSFRKTFPPRPMCCDCLCPLFLLWISRQFVSVCVCGGGVDVVSRKCVRIPGLLLRCFDGLLLHHRSNGPGTSQRAEKFSKVAFRIWHLAFFFR